MSVGKGLHMECRRMCGVGIGASSALCFSHGNIVYDGWLGYFTTSGPANCPEYLVYERYHGKPSGGGRSVHSKVSTVLESAIAMCRSTITWTFPYSCGKGTNDAVAKPHESASLHVDSRQNCKESGAASEVAQCGPETGYPLVQYLRTRCRVGTVLYLFEWDEGCTLGVREVPFNEHGDQGCSAQTLIFE